mgnify:CR=1 FL=1
MAERKSAVSALKKLKPVKYHTETFEKISEEKRDRIINAALAEISAKGFTAANINLIAKNAGISIGSMYQYFNAKEDLFLTVLDEGYRIIERSLQEIDLVSGDIFDKLEQILLHIQKYAREYRLLNQLYLEATTQGLTHISQKISLKLETISSVFYQSIIRRGQEEGVVDKKIDPQTASFCIDNIILLLQFSYSSAYYRERMKIFAGEKAPEEDARIAREIMYFLRKALAP